MESDSRVYRDVVDSLYNGVCFPDRDLRITYWNKGAERITVSTGATPASVDDTMQPIVKRAESLLSKSKARGGKLVTLE